MSSSVQTPPAPPAPPQPPAPASDPHGTPEAAARLRRARFADRTVARLIRVGGVGVLLAVVAIFVFVGAEAAPLLRDATVRPAGEVAAPGGVAALACDEYREH